MKHCYHICLDSSPVSVPICAIGYLQVSKAGDKPQLVSTAALDITQWFDFGVPTGSYLLKPTSKSLKATHTCSFQEVPVHVGPSGPSEVMCFPTYTA